jgi:hypothetical protein
VKPITLRRGGYVCVDRVKSGDVVVGEIVSGGRRWFLLIVPVSERPHRPELSTMVALAGAAPR